MGELFSALKVAWPLGAMKLESKKKKRTRIQTWVQFGFEFKPSFAPKGQVILNIESSSTEGAIEFE
jgi:hypothetical protein